MNLANAPLFKDDQEYIDYFHAISLHEVSHYEIIPYDGLMHARLLKAAMKYVNQNFAPVVVNVFADLIIDTLLFLNIGKSLNRPDYLLLYPEERRSSASVFLFGTKYLFTSYSGNRYGAAEELYLSNFISYPCFFA